MGLTIVFGIGMFAVGLVMLIVWSSQRKKAKAAEAWPTIQGVILSAGLQEHRHHDSKTHRTSVTYEPMVTYQYSLMGQSYQGNSLAFGHASYDYNSANRKIAAYPQGAQVMVHYDPVDPAKAVLETKAAGGAVLIVIGILFMVLGAAVTILFALGS